MALFLFLYIGAACAVQSVVPDEPSDIPAPEISVAPMLVRPGDLVTVRGTGWTAEEPVYVSLRSTVEGSDVAGLFAIANTEKDGRFSISFFYPTDPNWGQIARTQVEAQAVDSDLQAAAALVLAQDEITTSERRSIRLPIAQPISVSIVDGTIAGKLVNLRMGPSLVYPVLDVVEQGQTFAVLGQNAAGTWLRVRLDTGYEGWVRRNLTDYTIGAPIVSAPPVPIPTPVIQSQVWRGEYYDNRSLSGPPVLVRDDRNVKFDWGYGSPSAVVPSDDFSAHWTRALYFPAGAYRFNVTVDNGIRLWVDGKLLIDEWNEFPLRTRSVDLTFPMNDTHLFEIDYFEALERAEIDFWWSRVSEFPEWRGAYFNNASLVGDPALVRNEPAIDFDWGQGSPGPDVANNRFAARWTRTVEFDQDVYRFRALMDDGLRLFIDGNLIIDEWRDGGLREVVVDYPLDQGLHAVRVDYYENIGDASAFVAWEKAFPSVIYPDWKGEYWANADLVGDPALVRNDANINFNWGTSSPPPPLTPDNFSARWTRSRQFDSGTYRFHLNVDDGVRMWVDGQLIVDEWQDGSRRDIVVDRSLAGGIHDLRVEFYERSGDAMISLWWEQLQQPGDYPDWKGEYWSNRSLAGRPVLVRNDPSIDFSWANSAPALGVTSDRFSTRWTRDVWFDKGTYRLYARADDGIRVWVDDVLVIERWYTSPGEEIYSADVSLEGQRRIKVEYYDDTGLALVQFWWQKLTDQPRATPTNTIQPTSTATTVPATNTPEFTPTATIEAAIDPTATNTPETEAISTETPTLEPTSTDTPEPEPTATETPTLEPTVTETSVQEEEITATPVITSTETITTPAN